MRVAQRRKQMTQATLTQTPRRRTNEDSMIATGLTGGLYNQAALVAVCSLNFKYILRGKSKAVESGVFFRRSI